MSLADQLASRGNALKKVETKEPEPPGATPKAGGGGGAGGAPPPRSTGMGGGNNFMAELNSKMAGKRT